MLHILLQPQSFDEIDVTISFTFGLKQPDSFAGHAKPIKNDDSKTMEAESFYEASVQAWDKYSKSSYADRKDFVRKTLSEKWLEINGEELTEKVLEFS